MLVCRKWRRVLDEHSLFYNVDFDEAEDLFISFMDVINRFPHRAMQVEDLCVRDTIPLGFNRRTLLNTFPNLHKLTVEYEKESYNSRPIQIKQSISKLRSLCDSVHCEVASQLLTSNLGGKLERLYLNFESVGGISTRTLLDQLSNLPVLNELTLQEAFLGINDLESIHHNISSIHVFVLDDITIVDSTMPVSISPVTSITTFNISIYSIVNIKTHIQFYQYVTKKYCNVDRIKFNDSMLSKYNDDSDRRRLYLDGIMDFYKVAAPKQTSFEIHDVPDGVNILDMFDEMGCELEELALTNCQEEILQQSSQSNQSRYIKKLSLMWTNVSSIHCIKRMEAPTVLRLYLYDHNRPIVDLSACLNACSPTLKELTLICELMELAISHVHLNSIETLVISCKSVDRRLADTISSSFPKLANLTLKGEITENMYITLSSPSFQKAKFSIPWKNHYGMTFKAPNLVEPQHYAIVRSECSLVPYAQLSQLPVLTVTCVSEKIVRFTNWVEILSV